MAFPRPMSIVSPRNTSVTTTTASAQQHSTSQLILSRLNSFRVRSTNPSAWEEALPDRPDSATLNEHPRIMAPARAYTTHARAQQKSSERPLSAVPSQVNSPFTISSPIGPPWIPTPEQYGGYSQPERRYPQRYSARMASQPTSHKPHWLSRLRSALRILIIVLSAAVAGLLVNTLSIYRGNSYLDLRNGEVPMTWPARTKLASTLILFSIATANFFTSIAVLALSFKKSFRRPIRSRDVYRIVAGTAGVITWATALATYYLLDRASKASLGQYSCTNRNVMSNGRYQYRTVCSEQALAFYIAIGAAAAEAVTLVTLAITAVQSAKQQPSGATTDEKLPMMSGGRFA